LPPMAMFRNSRVGFMSIYSSNRLQFVGFAQDKAA
jgi:hypothetical protein